MSFPSYPAYKDSSVVWLAEVPADWEIKALRSLARTGPNTFIDGDWIETPFITDSGVRLIQTGNVGIGAYKEQGFRYVAESTLAELNCTEVMPGDVLICRLADPVGRACIAPNLAERMITSVDVCILKTEPAVVNRFIVYLMCSPEYLGFMEGQCRGGTRDRVSRSFLGAVRLALPPFLDQSAIVAFLDHETAKIDSLVAEQERLIALLKEKRQAVISHAVTKGLDPNAPMKDSGVEWLGQVPAHWDRLVLKRVLRSSDYGISDALNEAEGIAVLRMTNVKHSRVIFEDLKFVASVPPELMLEEGDLLFNRTNSLELVGQVGLVRGLPARDISFASYLVRLRASKRADPAFLCYVLNHPGLLQLVRRMAFVAIGQSNLNPSRYAEIALFLPGVDEQDRIVNYLDVETTQLDTLTSEATRAITLLRERRAALISAAVTGKIDVRSFVPPEPLPA